jgi:hypothetical protein
MRAESLFEPDGSRFVPTELSRGPWSPDALHGGPVAALLARVAAAVDADGSTQPVRLTIDLLRPVPLAPLHVSTRVLRPGRKVQLVEASLHSATHEVARVTMLRIRREALKLPDGLGDTPKVPGPSEARLLRGGSDGELVAFHSHATEHRAVRGAWDEPGPIVDWIRLRVPVLPGETPSPLERVAAVADFGNGVSWVLPYESWSYINPDLTITLHRLPIGEWVCLDAVTLVGPDGIGFAESGLSDEHGRIGRAVQALLLERRGAR